MARITINEISQNYAYNVGNTKYATVALPIASCWGPGFVDPATLNHTLEEQLEVTSWSHFPSTQTGLNAFVSTYRGPTANHRLAEDYSYNMALTLLTAGYDVLVCRLCPGARSSGIFTTDDINKEFGIKAKYPGTFGNTLQVVLRKVPNRTYWNLIVYTIDASGVRVSLENLLFVFDLQNSSDNILHIDEITSEFLEFTTSGNIKDDVVFNENTIRLEGGSDYAKNLSPKVMLNDAIEIAKNRYKEAGYDKLDECDYILELKSLNSTKLDTSQMSALKYNEWLYSSAIQVYELLKDKLAYNPNLLISPGWDDQNISKINGRTIDRLNQISPIHKKLQDVAYYSRCATAHIDIPRSLPRSGVYNESLNPDEQGYAQLLSRYEPTSALLDINASLFSTHSSLFAPWRKFKYAGMSKQVTSSPSFLALMCQISMIQNQPVQYQWVLPSSRKSSVVIGKPDYVITKKIMDEWQDIENGGVGVNIIADIPELGTTIWGNSTLYEVPPATYQALANLSTRYLVNAIEDVVYRVGISITFTYNNEDAYGVFYAGVTPILDSMKNVGAIDDYVVRISDDLNGLDKVRYNSILGRIYLSIRGVINDITVDLVALPPDTDLSQYAQ